MKASEGFELKKRPKVLFLDSNESMLDLSGMKPQVTAAFNGRDDLMGEWFSTMLYHSLVETVTSNYHNFGITGAACMQMIAEQHGFELDKTKAEIALTAMKSIPVWPDVPLALSRLKDEGFKLNHKPIHPHLCKTSAKSELITVKLKQE